VIKSPIDFYCKNVKRGALKILSFKVNTKQMPGLVLTILTCDSNFVNHPQLFNVFPIAFFHCPLVTSDTWRKALMSIPYTCFVSHKIPFDFFKKWSKVYISSAQIDYYLFLITSRIWSRSFSLTILLSRLYVILQLFENIAHKEKGYAFLRAEKYTV